MAGTVHWAANAKAHAVLRELLRLGVRHNAKKEEWEGCTPLMITAGGHDAYGMRLILDAAEARGGEEGLLRLINTSQLGGKLRARALHHSADAAADGCTQARSAASRSGLHPASYVLHPASCILCPTSCIVLPAASLLATRCDDVALLVMTWRSCCSCAKLTRRHVTRAERRRCR